MVNTSVVFDSEINERSLDRTVDKVDNRLNDAGQIDIDGSLGGGPAFPALGGGRDDEPKPTKTDLAMLEIQQQTLKYQKQSAQEDTERNRILGQMFSQGMQTNLGGLQEPLDEMNQKVGGLRQRMSDSLPGAIPATGGMGLDAGPGMGGGELPGEGASVMDPLNEMSDGLGGLKDTFGNKLPGAIPAVGGVASKAMPIALAGAVGAGLFKAMNAVSGTLSATTSMFGTAMELFIRPFGKFLGNLLRPMASAMIDFGMYFNDKVGPVLSDAADVVTSTVGTVLGNIWNTLEGAASTLSQYLPSLSELTDIGIDDLQNIGSILRGAGSDFADFIQSVDYSNLLTGAAEGLADAIRSISLQDIWSGALTLGKWMFKGTIGLGKWMFEGAINWGQWMFRGAINWGQWMFRGAVDIGQWMFRGAIGLGQWMFQGALDLGENIADWAWNPLDWMVNWSWNPADYVNVPSADLGGGGDDGGVLGSGVGPDFGPDVDVPGLQRGGLVQSEQVVRVGEAGPEVIAPFAEIRRMFGAMQRNQSGRAESVELDSSSLERKMDTMIQELRNLDLEGTITIGQEQFAELVQEAQENTQTGRDPLQSP
jgi:hypothetical protein